MAQPGDIFDPLSAVPTEDARAPWDWVPASWMPPEPAPALQPGTGIPTELVDAAVAAAPAPVAAETPSVHIGYPRPMDTPAPEVAPPPAAAPVDVPAEPTTDTPFAFGIPGIGIPQHLFDQAMRGDDRATEQPQEEIQFEPSTVDDRVDAMSDEEFAQYAGDHEEGRRQSAAAEYARALKADRAQAEGELRVFQQARQEAAQKRAQLEADSDRIANESQADDNDFGRSLLGVIVGALGGLVQQQNGGRNIGLELITSLADKRAQDLARKQARIDAKIGAVDTQLGAARDEYSDLTRYRVAALEQAMRIIDADAAQYDPQGTAAIKRSALKRQVFAQKLAAINEYEERQIRRLEAEGKSRLEIAKFMADQENKRAQLELDKKRVGIEGMRASADVIRARTDAAKAANETQLLSPEYFAQSYPGNPRPPHEMTRKQYAEFVDLSTKGPAAAADARKSAAEATVKESAARLEGVGPGGSPYAVGDQEGNALVNKDGKVFEIKDDTQRRRATDIITSAQNVRRIADLVKIMRADTGGASSTVGSPEYQELQSLAGQVDFETFVGYGLGAPSEGDKALAEAVRGGKDISSFIHDPSSGFEAYAKGIQEKATTQLRSLGYTGKPVQLKSIEPAQALERSEAQNLDVWNQPNVYRLGGVQGDIAERAAQRAADSADALARQSDLPSLKLLANQVRDRVSDGTFTQDQADKVMKSVRREARRRLKAVRVGSPEHAQLIKAGPLMEDSALDAWLLNAGGTD